MRLECWRALMDAVEQGSIKSAGVSNFGVKHVSIFLLLFALQIGLAGWLVGWLVS